MAETLNQGTTIKILLIFHFLLFTAAFAEEIRISKTTVLPKYKEHFVPDSAKEVVIDKNRGLMWQDDLHAKTIARN